jgi:repressor LexA
MKAKDLNNNQMTVKAGLSIGSLGKQRKVSSGLSNESIAKILLSYSDLSVMAI